MNCFGTCSFILKASLLEGGSGHPVFGRKARVISSSPLMVLAQCRGGSDASDELLGTLEAGDVVVVRYFLYFLNSSRLARGPVMENMDSCSPRYQVFCCRCLVFLLAIG